MTTIVTRAGKGSPLTHTEVDTNFTNLNTAKLEAGAIALGTAAAPSISFTGDTNTGVFSPGADQLAISTNGTGKLFVNSTGNIGVLAASPSAWSYGGNIAIPGGGRYIASTSDDIRFASNLYESDVARYSANGFAARYRIADGTHQWSIAATGTAGNAITLNEAMRIHATGDVAIDTNTLYVDAVNNRVGLGTSSPAVQFQVNATSDTSIALSNSSSVTSGNRGNISMFNSAVSTVGLIRFAAVTDNVGTEIQFHTRPAAGSLTQSMTLDSSGRLLVGTSTARSNLYAGSLSAALQVEGTTYNTSALSMIANGSGSAQNPYPILYLGRSRGASVNSNTVVQNNDQVGAVVFTGADGTNLIPTASIESYVSGVPGANVMPGRLVFSTNDGAASASPTERMQIRSSGEFLMYDVYSRTDAAGTNVVVKSDGSMRRSVSSIKYKTDVETLQNSYADAILNVRPVWYRSLCEGNCPEHSWWGFIAEEVAAIDSRLVHWKTTDQVVQEDGTIAHVPCDPEPEGVAYDRFVPHLLNLIKRQGEAIAVLEAKVAALEAA